MKENSNEIKTNKKQRSAFLKPWLPALSLVGDETVDSKCRRMADRSVMYLKMLLAITVQKLQRRESRISPWIGSSAKGGLPGIARFLSALRAACCTVTFPSSTCLSSRSISF